VPLAISSALLGAGRILASLWILRKRWTGEAGGAGEELGVTGVVGSPWTLTRTVLEGCALLLVSHH